MQATVKHNQGVLFLDETLYTSKRTPAFVGGRFTKLTAFLDATFAVNTKAVEFEEVQEGEDGQEQTFLLNVGSADGGTFDLGIAGDMQTGIAYGANAAAIQTELRKIDDWGDVTVSGTSPGDFTITIPYELGSVDLVADFDDLTEGGQPVSTTDPELDEDDEYEAGVDTIHTYKVMHADGGDWDITSSDFINITDIDHDVSAAALKAAFVAADADFVDSEGDMGHVTVTLVDGLYTVTFTGLEVDGDNIDTVATSLTQTATELDIDLEYLQPGTNEWHVYKASAASGWFAQATSNSKQIVTIDHVGMDFRFNVKVENSASRVDTKLSVVVK